MHLGREAATARPEAEAATPQKKAPKARR